MANAALDALVWQLDLDVDRIGICSACMSFVAIPLGDGDEKTAKREARRMTPILWDEGLAQPALAALRRASAAGLRGAPEALVDLDRRVRREIHAAKAARWN